MRVNRERVEILDSFAAVRSRTTSGVSAVGDSVKAAAKTAGMLGLCSVGGAMGVRLLLGLFAPRKTPVGRATAKVRNMLLRKAVALVVVPLAKEYLLRRMGVNGKKPPAVAPEGYRVTESDSLFSVISPRRIFNRMIGL